MCSEHYAAEHGELRRRRRWKTSATCIESKQEQAQGASANVEFERLFAEKPNAFATRIAAYLGHPVIEPEVTQGEAEAAAKVVPAV